MAKTEFHTADVKREGAQIIIPEKMTFAEAREWLTRQEKYEEETVNIIKSFDCHPMDGAIALQKALKEIFGWASLVPTPGFFGPTPPTMVTIDISTTDTVQVPWGLIKVPSIAGTL